EYGDLANRMDAEDKARHHAEAAAAAAAAGPEEVGLARGVGDDAAATPVHRLDRDEVVGGETHMAREQAETAAQRIAGDADRRAAAGREGQAFAREATVDGPDRLAGANAHRRGARIDADVVERPRVDDEPARLREALERVAARAHGEGHAIGASPGHHGLD